MREMAARILVLASGVPTLSGSCCRVCQKTERWEMWGGKTLVFGENFLKPGGVGGLLLRWLVGVGSLEKERVNPTEELASLDIDSITAVFCESQQ